MPRNAAKRLNKNAQRLPTPLNRLTIVKNSTNDCSDHYTKTECNESVNKKRNNKSPEKRKTSTTLTKAESETEKFTNIINERPLQQQHLELPKKTVCLDSKKTKSGTRVGKINELNDFQNNRFDTELSCTTIKESQSNKETPLNNCNSSRCGDSEKNCNILEINTTTTGGAVATTSAVVTTTSTLYPIVIQTAGTGTTGLRTTAETFAKQDLATHSKHQRISSSAQPIIAFDSVEGEEKQQLPSLKLQTIQLQPQSASNNNKVTPRRKRKIGKLSTVLNQEVSARLATLRKRKTVVAVPTDKVKQGEENSKTDNSANLVNKTSAQEEKPVAVNFDKNNPLKPATVVVDDSSDLNRIESLSEHNVKRSNTKRKRNHSTVSFKSVLSTNRRRKRATTGKPGHDSKENPPTIPTIPLNITKKKRPRIMSLYDSRYQAGGNDGRGTVGNGYLTVARGISSNSSSVILADMSDGQDLASQYYLSNTGTSVNNAQATAFTGSNGTSNMVSQAPSMATLCNIGNTCYLNSVVYTLRFAPQFLHNLHHLITDLNAVQQNIARARAKSSSLGRGVSSVHMENARSWSSKDLASMEQYNVVGATALSQMIQKNSHQLLAEKLHELYQSLYRNELNESPEPHHADTLLHAIQDVSTIFEGNQQQDAHEFLMCVLNSIRETSQTLIKAIAECPDVIMNGYIPNPDEVEAEERDAQSAKYSNTAGGSGGGGGSSEGNGSSSSSALSALTSAKPSLFSRKSKRKEEAKNSKNSRLQSPLKEGIVSSSSGGGSAGVAATANSLFYLNSNDLNSASSAPTGQLATIGDETDASSSATSLLKDKQRLADKIRELGLDFFSEDFEGITVSTTKCLSCETVTEQKETMIDIAVPVPQAGFESNENTTGRTSSFIQNSCITREYFRNENKYRCEQCTGYTEAIRSISYEVLPRLLVIQLSRFSGGMEKINSYIPTSFTLQCFCSKCCELSEGNKLHIYKLYSVITHVGATMSVGHYIAYTCSLDWANEYVNCPKDRRRRRPSQERTNATTNCGGLTGATQNNNSTTSSITSSGSSFMKKMKFGRSKASSSGDMSKNVKHLNGFIGGGVGKAITNGIGKLSINSSSAGSNQTAATTGSSSSNHHHQMVNTTCQGMNCCAMRLCAQQQQHSSGNSTSEYSEDSSGYPNGCGYGVAGGNCNSYHHGHHHLQHATSASSATTTATTSGCGSLGRGSQKTYSHANNHTNTNNCTEPIWYMCDDDKIKAMTQREFEELLSPTRKITVTPYLLFYARFDLQSSTTKTHNSCGAHNSTNNNSAAAASAAADTLHTNSWSTESLQNNGTLGLRM